MNRRNFLTLMVGGVAASAAVRSWPFRVYSFPSKPIGTDLIFKLEGLPLYGLRYHDLDATTGLWLGLNRHPYPVGGDEIVFDPPLISDSAYSVPARAVPRPLRLA